MSMFSLILHELGPMNSRLFGRPERAGPSRDFWDVIANMSRRDDSSGDLGDVRREIDAIDNAILDLLIRRFAVVEKVKEIKGLSGDTRGIALRPAREAQVVRRLVAASQGRVPGAAVAKLWFELMAAASRFQSPVTIHLPQSPKLLEHQDLIRFHAGAEMPVVAHENAADAVHASTGSPGGIALCPLDDGGGALAQIEEDCMTALFGVLDQNVKVVAQLPFVAGTSPVSALVIGQVPFDPSGDDVTLLSLSGGGSAVEALSAAGLVTISSPRTYAGVDWQVFSVEGYVAADDARLSAPGLEGLRHIGGYAVSIDLGETR